MSFTWLNQGGAAESSSSFQGASSKYLLAPAGTLNVRGRYVTLPAAPYTLTAAFITNMINSPSMGNGLFLRQSSDGKLVYFSLDQTNTGQSLRLDKYTNPTTFNAAYVSNPGFSNSMINWLRIVDDGANRKFYYSADGHNFILFASHGNTDYITADQIGYGIAQSNASFDTGMTLLSWQLN